MNRNYQFIISLQDKFSTVFSRVSNRFDRGYLQMMNRFVQLENRVSRWRGMLATVSQSAGNLAAKLKGLETNRKIRVDSSDIDRADRKAGQFIDKMGRLREANGRFAGSGIGGGGGGSGGRFGFGGFLAGLFGGAAGYIGMSGLTGLGRSTLGAALSGESTNFALNELMGGRNAQIFQRAVDQYAPEKRDQLLAAGSMLTGAGIGMESLMPTIKMLNNIAALTPKASVEDLAYIQSKIKATGYVQGDEINMFRERGINLNPYLASVMGVQENQLAKLQEKGLISYDILEKAMQRFAGSGGKYDGAYERRRDSTVVGRYENMMGRVQTKLRVFGHDTLLPILSRGLAFVDQLFEKMEPLETAFGKLKTGLVSFGTGIRTVLVNLGIFKDGASTAENIVNSLAWVVNAAGKVFDTVGKVIEWFANSPIALLTAGLFGVWRIIPLVDKAWLALNGTFLATPIGAAIAAVVGLGAAFYAAWENFEWFRHKILDGWEGLKVFFGSLGTAMELIATQNWAGLVAFSNGMDVLAAANGRRAIQQDKLERLGIGKIGDRRKRRREGESDSVDQENPFGAAAAAGSGGGAGSLASAAGLSSSVGNAKSNNVTINIGSLLTNSGDVNLIESELGGDISRLESMLVDALLRVANSGARAAMA